MDAKISILFVGESWTSLLLNIKGIDMFHIGKIEDLGKWFRNELSKFPDIDIIHMPNHVAFSDFPKELDTLKKFDVVVLSDIGSNTLVLYPDFFKVPMGPNRLRIIHDYVKHGGGLVMSGGWNSFSGFMGIARYHETPIEEALPVEISYWDDRVETPEGIAPTILKPEHPILKNIPLEWPLFLGYNKVKLKEGAELLAKFGEDPFISIWDFGDGRAMAFTSDLAPHWGTAFVEWQYYGKFWYQAIRWLARR
ncbi:MAG: glutamine amidotransferase [Candidatus Bathyarchaeia archaeon]